MTRRGLTFVDYEYSDRHRDRDPALSGFVASRVGVPPALSRLVRAELAAARRRRSPWFGHRTDIVAGLAVEGLRCRSERHTQFGSERVRLKSTQMSVSGIPATPNLDKFEPRLLARGARQASAEDLLLFELAQKLAPVRSLPHPQAASAPGHTDNEPMRPFEAARGERKGTASVGDGPRHDSRFNDRNSHDPKEAGLPSERRPAGWARKASVLAPAGAALLGAAVVIAAFGPKEGSPGLPTTPHLIAAGQGATQAPQAGETVAIRSDPDVTPLKVIPPVEFVGSEQRRTNFDAGSSPVPLSSTAPAGAAQPAPGVFAGLSVAAPVRRRSVPAIADFRPQFGAHGFDAAGPDCGARRHERGRGGASDRRTSAACKTRPEQRKQSGHGRPADDAETRFARETRRQNIPPHDRGQDQPGHVPRDRGDPAPASASLGWGEPGGARRVAGACRTSGGCRQPGTSQSCNACRRRSRRRARRPGGRSDQIGRLGDTVRHAKIGGGSQDRRRAAQRQICPRAQRRDDRRSKNRGEWRDGLRAPCRGPFQGRCGGPLRTSQGTRLLDRKRERR